MSISNPLGSKNYSLIQALSNIMQNVRIVLPYLVTVSTYIPN